MNVSACVLHVKYIAYFNLMDILMDLLSFAGPFSLCACLDLENVLLCFMNVVSRLLFYREKDEGIH